MRNWLIMLGAVAMQPLVAAVPAAAQQAVVDPFEQVLDAIEAGMTEEMILESSVRALEATLRREPTIAAIERQRPGITAIMTQAAHPTLASYTKRVRAEYRPQFIAALRSRLTAEEAREIIGFFQTPVGRKLLVAAANGYDAHAATTAMAQGQAVTASHVSQDASAASEAALAGLSAAERTEVTREAASRPALLKLDPVRAEFNQIRARMEAAPMTAAEQATLQTAIQAALAAR